MTTPNAVDTTIRFKPSRAGIIGLWDYDDEEFVFADGRLVLRGHNGSGKTKALEVLFPLVLDGSIDARRLDPFSGEERTMKSNLLYRGQESNFGYVWMEFTRSTPEGRLLEAVTIGIGLLAHKAKERPGRVFFVTDGRVGLDFGLLTADSRPLRKTELEKLIGKDALHATSTAYRDAIDDRLFGLGRERYAQLINLLLQLRRPLLAKDLDPDKLSATLTAGLRPLDEHLIKQAAGDFENLAEIQDVLDALIGADTAVQDFLREYTAYMRVHASHRVDQITERLRATAGHCQKITDAAQQRRDATAALAKAQAERDTAAETAKKTQAQLDGLKNHEAIKGERDLDELRARVSAEERAVQETATNLTGAQKHVAKLEEEAERFAERLTTAEKTAGRHVTALLEHARHAGIPIDDDPLDLAEDVRTQAAARATTRRHDIGVVQGHLSRYQDAASAQKTAQDALDKAETEVSERELESDAAARALANTRTQAAAELAAFTNRWMGADPHAVLGPEDSALLTRALATADEPGATSLQEVFHNATDERRTQARRHQDALQLRYDETDTTLEATRAERASVAAQRDDAPPPSDLRPADRTDRPGAPLWQLVRFADHLSSEYTAAIEGALYGAGLLTAWVHPHPSATRQAVADQEADGFLYPLPPEQRPSGRTLANVLVPEEQEHVEAQAISAVLASIALADDLAMSNPGTHHDSAATVSTRGQFSLGVHRGAHPKHQPEYIGATARAARRRERLNAYDAAITGLESTLKTLTADLQHAAGNLAAFATARAQLPSTTSIVTAAQQVVIAANKATDARSRLTTASKVLDNAIAEAHERKRQLHKSAAALKLPTDTEGLKAVDHALRDLTTAAAALETTRSSITDLRKDLTDRRNTVDEQTAVCQEQAEALEARRIDHTALAERLRKQEETLGAPLRRIHEEINTLKRQLEDAQNAYRQADKDHSAQQLALAGADKALQYLHEALATAVAEQLRTAAALQPYSRPDLLRVLGATTNSNWTPTELWPTADQAAEDLMVRLTAPSTDLKPEAGARGALPDATCALYDALDEATRGRTATDSALKSTASKLSTALSTLESALASSDQGYHFEWEPDGDIILARVRDNDGPAPIVDFAVRLAEQVADQKVLLEERERTVLEDTLLTGLAQQVHSRTIEARDLVRDMDADTRAKPMSSGTRVGIRWVQSDNLTDSQRAVNKLLEKDARALGPAGLAELRSHLRSQIRAAQARDRRKTYQQIISQVLDYRSWRRFELLLSRPGGKEDKLTRSKHSQMSGGEKSASIHLPLFAAANAQYGSAHPTCPRLIALDEAFAGIDERYRPDLLALTVKFDLDLFMTGHDLWITYPSVPRISHYDMLHDEATHTVSAMLMLWDGEQIHDDLGYPGSDELAADILGFTPRRHAPVSDGLLTDINPDTDLDDLTEGQDDEE
ncbi:TIGR02680 family protein [Kitasatospora sp. NPDC001095]